MCIEHWKMLSCNQAKFWHYAKMSASHGMSESHGKTRIFSSQTLSSVKICLLHIRILLAKKKNAVRDVDI